MGSEASQLEGNAEGTQKKVGDGKTNEPIDETPIGTEERNPVQQAVLQKEVDDMKLFFARIEGRLVGNIMHNYTLIERRPTNIEQEMNGHVRALHEEVAQMRLQLKEILEVGKRAWEVHKFRDINFFSIFTRKQCF
ncbi:hypothetical protein Syun_016338 [Stephania yunnanensis]|uniref:Uncharacterized protein n=1 Tax=Stephania yunnanensis TaxID=152371 RepID=A0AAP0P4T1_9MAGN